jgi:hypothetical protein
LTEQERKKTVFNKAFIDKMRSENFNSVIMNDMAHLYTLSPISVLLKCETKHIVHSNKVKITLDYILIEDDVDGEVAGLFLDYAHIVNIRVVNKVPPKKVKSGRHRNYRKEKDDDDYNDATHEVDFEGDDNKTDS